MSACLQLETAPAYANWRDFRIYGWSSIPRAEQLLILCVVVVYFWPYFAFIGLPLYGWAKYAQDQIVTEYLAYMGGCGHTIPGEAYARHATFDRIAKWEGQVGNLHYACALRLFFFIPSNGAE
jgi:hypothetical protein